MDAPLLEVDGLTADLDTDRGRFRALDEVSFALAPGKTLCVVGESGCGKSLTALSILRLLPEPPARLIAGEVRFRGRDLLALSEPELRAIRGAQIAMIFQEPMTSLNPVFTVGDQIGEMVRLHRGASRKQARAHAVEMLRKVGISAPEERVDQFPHQLSGGMRQRVMVAIALSCGPSLLIADEPTTALDVTIQAQILDLIRALQAERNMALLLITHDLGLVAQHADEVAVMYAGRVVERGPVEAILKRPQHPYAQGLLRSVPAPGARLGRGADGRRRRLDAIPGMVPPPWSWPSGCRFRDRCDRASAECAERVPALSELAPGQCVACHHPGAP